jgi:hypothetical protein
MNNELIEKLSLLELEKKYLKRELDNNWYDSVKRKKTFDKIKEVNKKIENVKFKLHLERKMKNGNKNTF